MILLWGILIPSLPRFLSVRRLPFLLLLLLSALHFHRRTQRWTHDSMPWTHLNLICVILCRKKFRDHNEITRLKMINRMNCTSSESIHTETKLHMSWANEQRYIIRPSVVSSNCPKLSRLAWNKSVLIASTIWRPPSSAVGQPMPTPLHNSSSNETSFFPICLDLKWVAKISDNENPSFMRRYRQNAAPAPSTRVISRFYDFRYFAAIRSNLISQSCRNGRAPNVVEQRLITLSTRCHMENVLASLRVCVWVCPSGIVVRHLTLYFSQFDVFPINKISFAHFVVNFSLQFFHRRWKR